MSAKALFHRMMAERRAFPRGSLDHEYRTRAARQYVWMMRRVPVREWPKQ